MNRRRRTKCVTGCVGEPMYVEIGKGKLCVWAKDSMSYIRVKGKKLKKRRRNCEKWSAKDNLKI